MVLRSDVKALVTVALVALALLVLDRLYRLNPLLGGGREGFWGTSGGLIQMCGVNHAPCKDGLQCINGICRSVTMEALPHTPLPVVP